MFSKEMYIEIIEYDVLHIQCYVRQMNCIFFCLRMSFLLLILSSFFRNLEWMKLITCVYLFLVQLISWLISYSPIRSSLLLFLRLICVNLLVCALFGFLKFLLLLFLSFVTLVKFHFSCAKSSRFTLDRMQLSNLRHLNSGFLHNVVQICDICTCKNATWNLKFLYFIFLK